MSYLSHTVSNNNGIIHIGTDTQYPYILQCHRKRHGRFIMMLISQMLRDLLEVAFSNKKYLDSSDLQDLSSIEFKCDCEEEFRTPGSSIHNRNNHICLKKYVTILKPIIERLLAHNSQRIKNVLEEIGRNHGDHKDTSKREDSKSDGVTSSGSWYDALHNGEYDNFLEESYGSLYDRIRSKIDKLVRRISMDLIISKRYYNPIFLKFDSVNGYYPLRIINETNKTIIIQATKDDKLYVLKIGSGNKEGVRAIEKELKILISLESPPRYIPTLIDTFILSPLFTKISHICLVFDMYGLDLFEKILKRKPYTGRGLKIDSVRHITYQLVYSIRYLHNRGLIHNDIKLENILFRDPNIDHNYILDESNIDSTDDLDIVLIDFGLSIEANKSHSLIQGTIPYLSPEEIEGNVGSFETDIWAMGVVILELITGIGIFCTDILENMMIIEAITNHTFNQTNKGIDNIENYEAIRNDFFSEDRYDQRGVKIDMHYIPYSTNDEQLADFLSGCLNPNRKERYTIEQLYYHPFLTEYTEQDNREINID